MGMRLHDFMCMTIYEYSMASQGYFMRHARSLEGHRMVAYMLLSVNKKKGKALPPPHKIFPLLTDAVTDDNIEIPSHEVIENIFKARFNLK